MNLLITGGAGFIGSEFVRSLLRNQYNNLGLNCNKLILVDALTYAGNLKNLEETRIDSRLEFVHANINDFSLMNKLAAKVDLIINFAAESHVDRSIENPKSFINSNILGVYSLLEAAKLNNVKKFVQISTDEVYGSLSVGSSKESDPLAPNSPYSASKAAGDLLVRSYSRTFGLKTLVTRSCNNYGPYQNTEKLIPTLIKAANENIDLPLYGDGLNEREWIHVKDNCRAIAFLASLNNAPEIVNIGSGIQKNNLQIAKLILNYLSGSTSKISFVSDRKGHDFRYNVDSEILLNLGFKYEISFDEYFVKNIDWYINSYKFENLKNYR